MKTHQTHKEKGGLGKPCKPTQHEALWNQGWKERPVFKTGWGLNDPAFFFFYILYYYYYYYYSRSMVCKIQKVKSSKKHMINRQWNMIEGSHFHSLDEYLKSFTTQKIKYWYTKEQVQRQGNLKYGHFSLSEYWPHNHDLQFVFGHWYTVVPLQTLHYFFMTL